MSNKIIAIVTTSNNNNNKRKAIKGMYRNWYTMKRLTWDWKDVSAVK